MTERELRRTAVIIPPKGRAVLCVWCALPGVLVSPFAFWQSILAGVLFCLLWCGLLGLVYIRTCSFAAVLGANTLTVYAGVFLPAQKSIPRRAVTGVYQFRSPLLRLANTSLLLISTPGSLLLLPAVPADDAGLLARLLTEDHP